MRVMIDTDVVVAGLRSPSGASAEILRRVLAGRMRMVATVATIVEYEAVTTRPAQLAASGLNRGEALTIIDALAAVAVPVDLHFRWRPQLRDPNDEMVLEAAVNGGAETIITFNRRDFAPVPALFGIAVETPGAVLRRL